MADGIAVVARKTYHHGNLREALLDEAMKLLAEEGLAALSVARLAKRTGVSTAAPYRHFPHRLALLAATATRAASLLAADFHTAVAAEADPVEALAATAKAYVRFTGNHGAGFDLVFADELREYDDEALRDAGRAVMDQLLPTALAITGGDAGDALRLLERHIAGAHGYATLYRSGFLKRRTEDVEEIADEAAYVTRTLAAAVRAS